MALSQCLDDSPLRFESRHGAGSELNLQEAYNERHRLALEELLSGGPQNFLDFLSKERIPNFLSDDEIQQLRGSAVAPRCVSVLHEEEQPLEQSLDCSSLTYFPEVSDVEPPVLEMGWPAFTSGSYRGVTRAVAHFQPSYGENIYSCKDAARRMIRSAKEVIAIVTDSLTDLDVFKDLQEACCHRNVPVYILLDQSCAPAFLKLCRNISVRVDDLRLMRVRTITGTTYYMRSGSRITGKVHERFMLIDGNRVATGSYRFNWTDGKLNSSNLIELSGQIAEKFDEEFRILYAQSLPVNIRGSLSVHHSGTFEHLLIKHPMSSSPQTARQKPVDLICLTSTPSRMPQTLAVQPECKPPIWEAGGGSSVVSDSSTVGKGWMEQQHIQEEILAGSTAHHFPVDKRGETELMTPTATFCHISTQTSQSVVNTDTQTDPESCPQATKHPNNFTSIDMAHKMTSTGPGEATSPSSISVFASRKRTSYNQMSPGGYKDYFQKLTNERQYHYNVIRTKLGHMVTMLNQRRELADVTNMVQSPGGNDRAREQRDCGQGPNARLLVEKASMGTWPRARCVR
ncbi:protein FAM83D [Thalassophryne amazonica]|uniref:protein FAM83D n=1 Tax=Thalassophryne amazonica TaxID=390379 RepID=UPI0014710962|nr:protein FAM83D [Thalassophryne amazonica]